MNDSLRVHEIYASLQGESSFAGWPCVFVRLTGCNLRCSYCDTAYAFSGGTQRTLVEIESRVRELAAPFHDAPGQQRLPLVEVTGGEPLIQPGALPLLRRLCDASYTVLLETSGACDISKVDPRVRRIVDLKCPSSGEAERNLWSNLDGLLPHDEIKCVIGTVEDYEWCRRILHERQLPRRCTVLFSWVSPLSPGQRHASLKPTPPGQTPLTRRELAERIVRDALPVRFQLQLHKHVWDPETQGV